MKKTIFLMKVMLGISFTILLATLAVADILTVYASGDIKGGFEYTGQYGNSASGPIALALDITPFDTTLGTLNSVNMFAEVNASGSVQAWYYDDVNSANVIYSLTNTLAVTEMGNTVASTSGSIPLDPTWDPYFGSVTFQPVSANKYTVTPLTSGFGRFLAGPNPFQVLLTLTGSASSDNPLMTDVYFDFDGNTTLTIEYDYTPAAPVPEPATVLLFGTGLAGLVAVGRRKRS